MLVRFFGETHVFQKTGVFLHPPFCRWSCGWSRGCSADQNIQLFFFGRKVCRRSAEGLQIKTRNGADQQKIDFFSKKMLSPLKGPCRWQDRLGLTGIVSVSSSTCTPQAGMWLIKWQPCYGICRRSGHCESLVVQSHCNIRWAQYRWTSFMNMAILAK